MTGASLDETRGYIFKAWLNLLRQNLPPDRRLEKLFATVAPAMPELPGQYREWKGKFQESNSRGPSEDESIDFIASILASPA
jgi:hypothetical protein